MADGLSHSCFLLTISRSNGFCKLKRNCQSGMSGLAGSMADHISSHLRTPSACFFAISNSIYAWQKEPNSPMLKRLPCKGKSKIVGPDCVQSLIQKIETDTVLSQDARIFGAALRFADTFEHQLVADPIAKVVYILQLCTNIQAQAGKP